MNWNTSKALGAGRAVAVIGLAGAFLDHAPEAPGSRSRTIRVQDGLEGTWSCR